LVGTAYSMLRVECRNVSICAYSGESPMFGTIYAPMKNESLVAIWP
jgi:fructose-1,6-bisphosphatase/inositol monophosphatase family enzyme